MPREQGTASLREESWKVKRWGKLEEVTYDDGRVVYRVKIWDDGREPFTTQTFNDITPAYDFLDRVIEENGSHFDGQA